ncbi:hypothetical protein JVT61DRAFT_8212 [Boletus reticuloceps]|uniref:BAH domain-containing protein n=1 Tax=Boletus reticuloceps TaxID=495285 RepID=A0A8I2YWV2_9AGAM|nr:hypothetical protein JVT61DRAFT_8212 [Boletus reticuloceps]
MPRKKSRLTRKKKSDKKADKAPPEGLLSEREFVALPNDYGSFIVEDSEHEQHKFSMDDMAYIQHHDSGESGDAIKDNHWIGKIREIRGNGPDNVWVRVQWYWSPEEVAKVIKSFNPDVCGKYERLFSNNFDIISVSCFVDHVEVKQFEETSVYQDVIEDEEWYSRYHFLYDGRRISPKVTHVACPICKVPYTPGMEKVLHFCPRPGCCKFYHQQCLVKHGYLEKTREYRLLETWPDIDRTASVRDLADLGSYHPRKRQRKNISSSKESACDPLADFPVQLVAVAEQQIVRGTQGGGVVGNITSVVAARQLIYRALAKGDAIPVDWETRINISTASSDSDTLPNCKCPSCCSPI